MDLYPTDGIENIQAVKDWAVPDSDQTTKPDVTFQLQYRTEGGAWTPAPFPNAEITVNAANQWTALWEDLPSSIGGQLVAQYQAVELSGDGSWVQTDAAGAASDDVYTFTFVNTFTRAFTVEKTWNSSATPSTPITVGLYRTTDQNAIHSTAGERVPKEERNPSAGYQTAQLQSGSLTHSFTGLPKYDTDGQLYYYYALELDENGQPLAEGATATVGAKDYVVSYDTPAGNSQTQITNTPATELTGSKTWKDDGNEGGGRPGTLTLTLQRQSAGSSTWSTVTGVTPTWTNTETDVWTYRYAGLPQYDLSGNLYTYRVLETVPAGYVLENQTVETGLTSDNNFVNRRTGTVNLTVQKTWKEGAVPARPQNITLKVEQKTIHASTWTELALTQPAWTEAGDTWTLAYTGLSQYDENGVRYEYRVTEVSAPDGYEKKDSANTDPTLTYKLENIQLGSLTIAKKVTGNRGETTREFHFVVTLNGQSQAETAASAVTGNYAATYTDASGAVTQRTVAFDQGVSEPVALKHGETIAIAGLPAGLGYAVAETEANQEGYATTATGGEGLIPVGAAANAVFENYRHDGLTDLRTDILGTKTWVDDSNASGKRPDSLTLTLYRSVPNGPEMAIQATPVWTKNGDVWTYAYYNLLKYDAGGQAYLYRVVETVPEGYVGSSNGNNFTNTLAEEFVTLSGQKSWAGDDPQDRPESITVVLYADGLEVRRVTVTAAEGWSYVFEDVPKLDEAGEEIHYTVQEHNVPEGYQAHYDGLNILNQKDDVFGSLQVTKQVRGPGAETDRAFSFTVTLDDDSINGTYGGMTFVDGVATFTLKHGQSAVAADLPAGVAYTVTEDTPKGYTASWSNASGVIPNEDVVTATFVNTVPDTAAPDHPDVPQTDDQGNLALYGILTGLFALLLIAALWLGKQPGKKKRR